MLQVVQVPFETSSVGVVLLCYRSSVFFLSSSSLDSRRMYLSYTESISWSQNKSGGREYK